MRGSMMYTQVGRILWGDASDLEHKKGASLAFLFFLIVGGFWLVGSLQEPVLYQMVGVAYHGLANTLSLVVWIPFLCIYTELLRRMEPRKLFRALNGAYLLFFAVTWCVFQHPSWGLTGRTSPYQLWGWLFFIAIKSYGSLFITLFWSIATSIVEIDFGRRLFPIIIALGQVGAFLGATGARYATVIGIPAILCAALALLLLIDQLYLVPVERRPLISLNQAKVSDIPSFRVLITHCASDPYVRNLFFVSTLSTIVAAVTDYYMQYLAHAAYPNIGQFAEFKGLYGQYANALTLLLSLGLTRVLISVLGVRGALILYPLSVGAALCYFWYLPVLSVALAVTVLVRGLGFGLYNPLKELLYIPTESSTRFVVKGWIDMFGYRAAWVVGTQVAFCAPSISSCSGGEVDAWRFFVTASGWACGVLLVLWILSSILLGNAWAARRKT